MEYIPYVYSVIHVPTGQFYIGCKYGKSGGNTHPDLFWVKGGYFTSSDLVKQLIEEFGAESFIVKVRKTFSCPFQTQEYEKRFIRRVFKHKKCLNLNIGGVKVDYENKILKMKVNGVSKYDLIGKKSSEWYRSIDPETGLTNAQIQALKITGIKRSQETIEKIRLSKQVVGEDGLTLAKRLGLRRTGSNNTVHIPGVKEKVSEGVKRFLENESEEDRSKRLAIQRQAMKRPEVRQKQIDWNKDRNPARNTFWYNDGVQSFRLKPDDPKILSLGLYEGRIAGDSISGHKYEKVVCPHCDTAGAGGNMKRYHFDNCSKRNNEIKLGSDKNDSTYSLEEVLN